MQVKAKKGTQLWIAAPGAGCACATPELVATLELDIFMEIKEMTKWENLLYEGLFKISWETNPGWIILVGKNDVEEKGD